MWATAWATLPGPTPSTTPARAAPTRSATPPAATAWLPSCSERPTAAASTSNVATAFQNLFYGAYIQDDFRPTPKLTVNMGFRWEYEGPRTERYDQMTRGFAYDTPSPLQSVGAESEGEWRPDVRRTSTASRAGRPIRSGGISRPASASPTSSTPSWSCAPATASSSPAPPTPAAAPALLPVSASPRPWSPAWTASTPPTG